MELKQAIVIRSDLKMGKGKIAAQSAHASLQAAFEAQEKTPGALEEWLRGGAKKITLKIEGEKRLHEIHAAAKRKKLPCALIADAGHTQVEPGTFTAVAIGPAKESEIDAITGSLKLL